jgi:hypothetical protein
MVRWHDVFSRNILGSYNDAIASKSDRTETKRPIVKFLGIIPRDGSGHRQHPSVNRHKENLSHSFDLLHYLV